MRFGRIVVGLVPLTGGTRQLAAQMERDNLVVKHEAPTGIDGKVRCTDCQAVCCRLEVLLITNTGVPEEFIETDQWGGMTMARLSDGWCSALDRNTNLCRIYENRPWVCREFQMGGADCVSERAAYEQMRS